jgi:MFS family permease
MSKRNIFQSIGRGLREYGSRIRAFRPNARLYLLNVIITGAAMGVFRLLFNFYILSLGYDEALIGTLVTVNSFSALLMALPMGYTADLLGRKASLLLSGFVMSMAVVAMVLWPTTFVFYAANIVFGIAQSLAAVTMAPFLMENSGEEERTYLFSFGSGLMMASASVGNWIGGYLPGWMGAWRSVESTSSEAYGGAMLVVGLTAFIALIPLSMLKTPKTDRSERSIFAPLTYAFKNPSKLSKLILPMLVTSIGAGLIMPFMNVFFRQVHDQPDPVIGALFAWGSLAMGIGLLIAPPLADRMGKIQLVVITQGLSIPFLILLGFSPLFWMSAAAFYMRLALMNMSGPVYQTFVMEQVEPSARATVASLVSMSWNFGWAFSPMISGWMQVNYGFNPPFIGTLLLYTLSVYLYWTYFWRKSKDREQIPIETPGD